MRKSATFVFAILLIGCSSDDQATDTENSAPVINAQVFLIPEHSAEGTSIGSISASDEDGDNLTFTLDSNTNIEINETTGELTVGNQLELDFETNPNLTFTVSVFDGKITADRNFILEIEDVDEITLLTDDQKELISYFQLLTLGKGPHTTPIAFNTKWGSPMKIYLDGSTTPEFETMVQNVVAQYNTIISSGDFSISLVNNIADANAHVFFGTENDLSSVWPDMYDIVQNQNYNGFNSTPYENSILISTRIWLSVEHEVLFKHELGHALGLRHSDRCTEKSFMCSNMDLDYDILPIEEDILRYLYRNNLMAGLSESEIEIVLANILINE